MAGVRVCVCVCGWVGDWLGGLGVKSFKGNIGKCKIYRSMILQEL